MAEAEFQPSGFMTPQVFGLPVDRKILFSNHKDVYKKRIEKRQRKLFVKLGPIKPFLRKNEHILLVTTGYSPLSSLGNYLTGFAFSYLKRSLFVFTNLRIIHVPTTASYKYKNTLAQIAYAGCQSITMKRGTLVIQFAKLRRIEKFKAIAVQERNKIRALVKKHIPTSGTKGHLAGRIHLCPRCGHRLEGDVHLVGIQRFLRGRHTGRPSRCGRFCRAATEKACDAAARKHKCGASSQAQEAPSTDLLPFTHEPVLHTRNWYHCIRRSVCQPAEFGA